MNSNILEYKGYHTKIEFSAETCVLHGKIEGIRDLVNFICEDPSRIEHEFHDAVDDYLDFCKEVGKEPDKEYKGSFNVRIDPLLHRSIAIQAFKNGESLNSTVSRAIKYYLENIDQAAERESCKPGVGETSVTSVIEDDFVSAESRGNILHFPTDFDHMAKEE